MVAPRPNMADVNLDATGGGVLVGVTYARCALSG